jgi:hypothetical protein
MQVVIVKYNRPSTLGLTAVDTNNNGFVEHNLVSGVNEVPSDVWEKHEGHPSIKNLIEEGVIEVAKPKSADSYLLSLNVRDALDAVRKTINTNILQKWLQTEKRKPLVKAIEKQMKDLSAPPQYRNRTQTQEEKLAEAGGETELNPDFTGDVEE